MNLTRNDILLLDKSDLHAHLGSMVGSKRLWELAHEQGLKLPTKDFRKFNDIISGTNDSGLNHKKYLNKFNLTQKIQGSPLAVEQSVFNAISESYLNDNITLLELRFNPFLRNRSGFYDVDMVISHACIGLIRAMSIYPVKAGIIISTDRSFDKKLTNILAKKAIKYKNIGVIGFDMSGGNVSEFNIKDFESAFKMVKEADMGTTIHTAEVANISLDETKYIVKNFDIDRIGHGIRIIEDINLLTYISSKRIHLEICPTSNVITKCVNNYKDFNKILNILQMNHVDISINTDGCVFLNTSVTNEYDKLHDIGFVYDIEQIKELEQSSIKASFIR